MNYRHVYHAGNFADVQKHVALVAILSHLKKKETPFAVFDTHAGRGVYDLSCDEARRTGEAADGIARLRGYAAQSPVLEKYLEIAGGTEAQHYPGSPLVAAQLFRRQDRLVAIEEQPEEYECLRTALSPYPNARAMLADGYAQLPRLLPPPEHRGLVLIDPPYEDSDELHQLANSFADAYRRFANGIYLIWLPLKEGLPADALAGELRNAGATKLLLLTFVIGRAAEDPPGKLFAAALLVVNPPFGFDAEIRAATAEILPLLQRSPEAEAKDEWLAGGP